MSVIALELVCGSRVPRDGGSSLWIGRIVDREWRVTPDDACQGGMAVAAARVNPARVDGPGSESTLGFSPQR